MSAITDTHGSVTRTAAGGRRDSAWVAKAAKQPLQLEEIDLGPLGGEEVEIAVEHCGLCHSDLSVANNDWGISQYPAILGHEVVGLVTAAGPGVKGLKLGQRVGVGWNSCSCMPLQTVYVWQSSSLPASTNHDCWTSRWLRDSHSRALGLGSAIA